MFKQTSAEPPSPVQVVQGVYLVPATLMLPTILAYPDDMPESEDDASVCSFIPDDA